MSDHHVFLNRVSPFKTLPCKNEKNGDICRFGKNCRYIHRDDDDCGNGFSFLLSLFAIDAALSVLYKTEGDKRRKGDHSKVDVLFNEVETAHMKNTIVSRKARLGKNM
jgi:hypothetical protein